MTFAGIAPWMTIGLKLFPDTGRDNTLLGKTFIAVKANWENRYPLGPNSCPPTDDGFKGTFNVEPHVSSPKQVEYTTDKTACVAFEGQ